MGPSTSKRLVTVGLSRLGSDFPIEELNRESSLLPFIFPHIRTVFPLEDTMLKPPF